MPYDHRRRPPPFDNWKDAWEWHVVQAAEAFAAQSEATLLAEIQAGRDDPIPKLRARVQWDHDGEEARQAAILELEQLITRRLTNHSSS
jgi:hypothetical protein